MRLNKDQRGFVLSGIALLLILPALLLPASCLAMIKSGGEAISIQALADKVHNAGLNVEETIKWMWAYSGVPIDNYILLRLREEYENVTGLLINISTVGDNQAKIRIVIQDPLRSARFDNILALMEVVRK